MTEDNYVVTVFEAPGGKCTKCHYAVITDDGECPFCGGLIGDAKNTYQAQ